MARATSQLVDHGANGLATRLTNWRTGNGSMPLRLATSLQGLIESGALAPSGRLPSERQLARSLGVSRGTVVAAYDRLASLGSVERSRGSGTYIAPLDRVEEGVDQFRASQVVTRWMGAPAGAIDLSLSVLPDTRMLPVIDVTPQVWLSAPAHGYSPLGDQVLRSRIAEHLGTWGLPTDPDQLIITNGAQEAISVVASCLLSARADVLVESPSYPGAIAIFLRHGARIRPVECDRSGIVANALQIALAAKRPALIYAMPIGHNPTGSVTNPARSHQCVQLAAKHRTVIVEDLSLADLVLEGNAPRPMAAVSSGWEVVSIGSLSKVLWGGLRIGWIRASAELLPRLMAAKATINIATSPITQQLAASLLGRVDHSYLDKLRRTLLARRDDFLRELATAVPEWLIETPKAGLSVWARLPAGTASDFTARAAAGGVAVAPGSLAAPDGSHDDYVRICFAIDSLTLRLAMDRLKAAWQQNTT